MAYSINITNNTICHIILWTVLFLINRSAGNKKRQTVYGRMVWRRFSGKGEVVMVFNTGAALLDAIVLAVVSREPEGAYGYKITQDVRQVIALSESTLYPVLRRLQKDECLEVYDRECAGRNRRYYKATERGRSQLNLYKSEWLRYSARINSIFEGGIYNE